MAICCCLREPAGVGGGSRDSYFRHCERSEAIHSQEVRLDCFVACAPRNDGDALLYRVACRIFRRQSRHRQSPPSTGIGSRAVSSAHQHGPAGRQVNSIPQAEQARRRDTGFSNRFVMKLTKLGRFNVWFMPNGGMIHKQYRHRTAQGKSDGPRFASCSGRAQSLRIWRARRRGG